MACSIPKKLCEILKNQLSSFVSNVSGFVNVSDEQVYFDAEKSIKQTLFQFQHLQKVWQEVLPGSIYRKAVGKIDDNYKQEKFVRE